MKTIKGVQSTVKPSALEFDDFHVYVNSNIHEVEEENLPEREEGVSPTIYEFDVEEYTKDEYIQVQDAQLKQTNSLVTAMLSGEVQS